MLYVISELDMFTTSLAEAKEFIKLREAALRGKSGDVEVLVYDMRPAEFMVNHWRDNQPLPAPNLRINLPRRPNHIPN